jgi:glycosyltransferase involved in cell wall biosynthesis
MTELAPGGEPEGQVRPRLAVLIPVFNDQPGLEKALASLARDGAQFDVFVVDDGSAPPARVPPGLPYGVRIVRQEPNQGITAALNAGLTQIAAGRYQYLARLDAGDISLPGRFRAQMRFLDSHPDHAVVGTATRYVDAAGKLLFDFRPPTRDEDLKRFLRYRAGLVHPSVMLRLEVILAAGGYRDRFRGGEDYDLFMRIGRSHKLANLTTLMVVKEVTAHSITSKRRRLLINRLKLLSHHFDPWCPHSYLGAAASLALVIVPRSLVLRSRHLLGVWRGRSEEQDRIAQQLRPAEPDARPRHEPPSRPRTEGCIRDS